MGLVALTSIQTKEHERLCMTRDFSNEERDFLVFKNNLPLETIQTNNNPRNIYLQGETSCNEWIMRPLKIPRASQKQTRVKKYKLLGSVARAPLALAVAVYSCFVKTL